MAQYTVYTLGAADVGVSGGGSLSGFTQGDGSHLIGRTLTLNSNQWTALLVEDDDAIWADNDASQVLATTQTVYGQTYAAGRVVEAEYTLNLQAPDGTVFRIRGVNINEPGSPFSAFGTIEGLSFVGGPGGFPPIGVPLTVISAGEGPANTGTDSPYQTYATPICFASGTLIATSRGDRLVEELDVGDLVMTADDGLQPLRWVARTAVSGARLRDTAFCPVLIRAGALGADRPTRDLRLSAQHRVLLTGWRAELMFGEAEVLVSARSLVNGDSILCAPSTSPFDYHHLMFDRHQIVFAEGLPSESFLPGAAAMATIPQAAQDEIFAFFPELRRGVAAYGAPARPVLRNWEGGLAA